MDEGTSNQIDPSSISLFNCPSPGNLSTNDVNGSSLKFIGEGDIFKVDGQKISYSKYADNKGKEVAKRRIFVERMERMKEARGLFFNIPQFNLATMNQVCMAMKKFSRAPDVKSFISTDLLEHAFSDIPKKQHKQLEAIGELNEVEADILKNTIKPSIFRQVADTSDEDLTEVEEDEYAEDKTNLSSELYDLLEQRAQILTADLHAKRMLKELEQKQLWTEVQLSNLKEEELLFESPATTGDEEVDSMTCARCRPLIGRKCEVNSSTRFSRELIHHNFPRHTINNLFRPLISNKKCSVSDYAFADESIHRLLSLPSSISLDVQLQKYLHVISFISPEVELRRYRTARIINQINGKNMPLKFCDLMEDSRDEQTSLEGHNSHYEEGSRGIRLSLHKRSGKQKRRNTLNYSEEDIDSDDLGDGDFVPLSNLHNKKRRRMTCDNPQVKKLCTDSKLSKLENRRLSHVEFGTSMFDYDAQLMDIGLPLPTIQNVENVEIAVPSFRRRPTLLEDNISNNNTCLCCQNAGEEFKLWEDIRRLHRELETKERQNRCTRPSNISTT